MKVFPSLGADRPRRSVASRLLMTALGLLLGLAVAVPAFATGGEGSPPQVVGGTPVPSGDYRFVASLGDVSDGVTAYGRHFCGGTLIDRNSVLTAAHCMGGTPRQRLRVTVGRTVLSGDGGQTRSVARIAIHPRYNGLRSDRYDAAVLTLNNPVGGIPAIRLSSAAQNPLESPGRLATVAGWGNTIRQPPSGSGGINYPDRMRSARVPIVSDARARNVYGPAFVGAVMVAAGKRGKDTCSGDSGGPMFAAQADERYQIGITSFGIGCAARGYPGVYTEVNAPAVRRFVVRAAGL